MRPDDPRWPQPSSRAATAVMRANRSSGTSIEQAVRAELQRRGLRFRKNLRIELGDRRWTRPDVTFTRVRVAVFVDGCFWHSCPEHGTTPRANTAYWRPKLEGNVRRDRDTDRRLARLGWKIVRAWEHEDAVAIADRVSAAVAAVDPR